MRDFVIVTLLMCIPAAAQTTATKDHALSPDTIARLVGYSLTRGGASDFLETLTDTIGGRITGSKESRATANLILKTLKEAGLSNPHFEEYQFAPGWEKGTASGEILTPVRRSLYVGTYSWVPGTPGAIEVPVADLGSIDNGNPKIPTDVRGAAVLVDLKSNALSTTYVGTRMHISQRLAQAGAAAMLIVSDKPDRMLYTSAFLFYPRGALPVLSIANEDASLLRRLLAKGEVKIRLDVQNSFDDKPQTERNVVADLEGNDPSQMVLLTAHFDSWDAAQGANDNGAGVAVVLEAARILKSMNLKPRRTLRFVFFSGEEQGDLGSKAYVEQHKSELNNVWAVINTDHGAQTPLGLQLYGRDDLRPATEQILKPLAPMAANQIVMDAAFDSDEEPFMVVGVPTYSIAVEDGDYNFRHHTIIDTFERIDPRMLGLQTAIMAVAGYSFADAEQRPGKRLSPSEVHELLKKTGLEPLYELDYPDKKPY
jgi:carboxypeptidase Q